MEHQRAQHVTKSQATRSFFSVESTQRPTYTFTGDTNDTIHLLYIENRSFFLTVRDVTVIAVRKKRMFFDLKVLLANCDDLLIVNLTFSRCRSLFVYMLLHTSYTYMLGVFKPDKIQSTILVVFRG